MGCTLRNTKYAHELAKWRERERRALVETGVKNESVQCTVQRVQPDRGHHCAARSERGLGCALIKSTLGSGNLGRAGNLGGERTREHWGTKGISLRATWD